MAERLEQDRTAYRVLRTVRHLVPSTCQVVDAEIARALARAVDVDVVTRLVDAWLQLREVQDACARTAGPPTTTEVVTLRRRRGALTYHPSVTLCAEPLRHTLVFDLVLAVDVVGLAAVVEGGGLRAFEGGRCTADATLSLDGSTLATWTLAPDVNVVVRVPGQRSASTTTRDRGTA